jgi:prepilin-type N-terminal cleavage/methylation domain-containing protein
MRTAAWKRERGFSLVDMLVVTAIIGIVSAIAVPTMLQAVERMRLGQSAREVEREIQTARQRAVSRGRALRVRFNCPAAGQYRIVELIGPVSAPTAVDQAANRCNPAVYPYPAPDNDVVTRPNLDGPVRRLDPAVSFSASQTLEFWSDGTVHYAPANEVGNWPMLPPAGINISVSKADKTSTLTVNGLGRIQLQ